MALIFIKYMPNWTTWAVLVVISLWDLFAVLAPFGPLRILVETAQERNEQIMPSLIYSAGVVYSLVGMADAQPQRRDSDAGFTRNWVNGDERNRQVEVNQEEGKKKPSSFHFDDFFLFLGQSGGGQRQYQQRQPTEQELEEEDRGIKLGLGDFIFYSILVGKASAEGDWNTTLACFVAILIGLCLTLMFLAICRKALPALPFSIAFGLVFFFLTSKVISPFTDELSARQIFI